MWEKRIETIKHARDQAVLAESREELQNTTRNTVGVEKEFRL